MLSLASDARDQQPGGQFLVVPVSLLLQPGQQCWRGRRDPAYPVDEDDEGNIGKGVSARPMHSCSTGSLGSNLPGILAASATAARCSAKL